jgi:hypothetical protein
MPQLDSIELQHEGGMKEEFRLLYLLCMLVSQHRILFTAQAALVLISSAF